MSEFTAHEERYYQLLEKDNLMSAVMSSDPYRRSLFYILAGNEELYQKIDYIYDFKERWIKDDCFENVDFSSSARKMANLAFNLYNGTPSEDPLTLFSSLDNANFETCIKAIKIRFKKY